MYVCIDYRKDSPKRRRNRGTILNYRTKQSINFLAHIFYAIMHVNLCTYQSRPRGFVYVYNTFRD